jgi:hypothetical protein
MTRVALVPGVLALLPEYAGIEDPVAELRAACLAAVSWLGGEVTVLGDPQGRRVAESLLEVALVSTRSLALAAQPPGVEVSRRLPAQPPQPPQPAYLVVGNGSAKRSEKAPGHFDERAEAFDAALGESLRAGAPEVDRDLARDLWAAVDGISEFPRLSAISPAEVTYDDTPYGVQYWVMTWTS